MSESNRVHPIAQRCTPYFVVRNSYKSTSTIFPLESSSSALCIV